MYWNLCLLVKINGMRNIVWCDYCQLSVLYFRNGNPHGDKKNIPKHNFNQSLYSCFKSKWWVMVRTMNPLYEIYEINTDDLVFNVPIPLIKINVFWKDCKTIHSIIQSDWNQSGPTDHWGTEVNSGPSKNRMLNFRETSSMWMVQTNSTWLEAASVLHIE